VSSVLATRVVTAAVLVAAVLAALFLLPPYAWGFAVLAVVTAGAHEWGRLIGLPVAKLSLFVVATLVVGAALLAAAPPVPGSGWPQPVVAVACGLATLFWVALGTPAVLLNWQPQSKWVGALAAVVVLIGAFVAVVELQARSPWLVLAAMAIVWIADTAAYFSGRAFGRRKLAPEVSPGKTWEGVYGALAAVALYALCLLPFARDAGFAAPLDAVTVAAWLAFMLLVTAVSVVGDLYESLLKRHAGVKDSGNVLPGHGGVLDRADALLAAMPFAALAAQLFLAKA
jgi:phosphatidate cytidylyltransferase